jgi:hypothetical protein
MTSLKAGEQDFYLGRYALDNNLASREALLECLYEVARDRRAGARPGASCPLGELLISKRLLTREEVETILSLREAPSGGTASTDEDKVGQLLVAAGILEEKGLERCLSFQQDARRAQKAIPRLGEVVVRCGYATQAQVEGILAKQRKLLFACKGCGLRITATAAPSGTRYRCKKCGGELAALPAPGGPGALSMREATYGEETQFQIDRAVALYLKQKTAIRRDQVREAQRLQSEFARYGIVVPLAELLRRSGAISVQQSRELETVDFLALVKKPDWKKQAVPGYKLLRRVASGGFSTIYTAEAVFQGGLVAAKVLHPERSNDPRAVARLQHEAELLRRFVCPQIVRGLEYGSEGGVQYLIMEYFEGRSLGQALSEGGPFPLRNALSVTRQIAEALHYLHSNGYLHRDVKPDNVLIDDRGLIKLCDLGFASPIPGEWAAGRKTSVRAGTVGYMAPEAHRGEADIKAGSDIYSLGILLYALLSGQEPFVGESSEEAVGDQIEKSPPVPNLMAVMAPPAVIQLLKRLMHPDPSRRFATAAQALEGINQAATTS